MSRPSRRWPTPCAFFLLLIPPGALHGMGFGDGPGVVVEEVRPDLPADQAGMKRDDVIVSWSRASAPPANPEAASGAIESSFDLAAVEFEEAPRGPVVLAGRRGETAMTWTVARSLIGLTVRPSLPAGRAVLHQEGRDLLQAKNVSEAAARWRAGAEASRAEGRGLLAAWFWARGARALSGAGKTAEADAFYEEALRDAESAPSASAAAQLLREWAYQFEDREDWDRAQDRYRRALALDEGRRPQGLAVARNLRGLAGIADSRGDQDEGEKHALRALAINEKLAPISLELAGSLNDLGLLAMERRNLAAAEDYYRRALVLVEKLAPGRTHVAVMLNNLGSIAKLRGDPAAAEQYYRGALAINEKLLPDGANVAANLNNLGLVAKDRGDLEAAHAYQQRALAINERLAPGGGIQVSSNLSNLGIIAEKRGDLVLAADYFQRSLAMKAKLGIGGLRLAGTLDDLGRVAALRGDLGAAEDYHRRALSLHGRLAPGTADEAESLHGLGLVYRRLGRVEAARGPLLAALDALERQRMKLGGAEEVRSVFAAAHAAYYHDAITALLELGERAEAFHVLERSRARSLLTLLSEREVPFSADLSAELARERKGVDAEYERVQARLGRLDPARDEGDLEKLLVRLRELRQTQESIAARIRQASPRFASIQYPVPLDLAATLRTLDPQTVLLAYSVGAEESVLFAVRAGAARGTGLSVVVLPVGEKALREKVQAFRRTIQRPTRATQAVLRAQAAELYDLLLRPAQAEVALSERVMFSLDGPLHSLPFAALVRNEPAGRPAAAQYLVEWKPLFVVASATVHAELKKSRREGAPAAGRLAAFGDPSYPLLSAAETDQLANPDLRAAGRLFSLAALPHTRHEVEHIARLFPLGADTYLGAEATEERAKSLDKRVRYIHFACHGYLDERFPLNSALALAMPATPAEGQDNGLLQAWEIFDRIRIDADLVTLSACETALGKEMGGEGLLGLTRAFLYAGARSVLATLWGVSDASTPLLMGRFYTHLRAGKSRDEALRAAQVDFIRGRAAGSSTGRDLSHPFRWAAFQLTGDWR